MIVIRKAFLIVLGILSMIGCQKQPHAGFNISPKTAHPGEKINCINTSVDGYSYMWTLQNGNTASTKDISFNASSTLGERTVKLEVFSKRGKKTSTYVNTYTVVDFDNKSFVGNYSGSTTNDFFTDPTTIVANGNDKITVDGQFEPTLDFTITSTTSGNIVPKISTTGTYTYNFKSGTISRNGNVITMNFVLDFTDSSNSTNNIYNYSVSDVIVKQ